MAEREPALLGGTAGASGEAPVRAPSEPRAPTREPKAAGRDAPTVHVAGFWRRFAAGWIDLGIILPVGLVLAWIASALADVHLPPSRIRGPDFWLDLVLASDPALMTAFAMILIVAIVYLMVFQVMMGRTLGMRVLKMRVIDVWGDRPSIARCAARTAGYLAGLATVMLGFLWVGFDSEKRGLHDWIAGTYVIRA
jgi:uncharacterized RDD family membrane protein YckC